MVNGNAPGPLINGVSGQYQGSEGIDFVVPVVAGGMGPWDQDENDQRLIDLDDALRPLPTVNGYNSPRHDRIIGGSFPTVGDDNQVADWDGIWALQSEPEDDREDNEMEDDNVGRDH